MRLNSTAGCCAAGLIYDLGHAHGKATFDSLESFSAEVARVCSIKYNSYSKNCSIGNYSNYYAFTNEQQSNERKYLEEMGFETLGQSGVKCHFIKATKLAKWFNENDKWLKEEKAKKAEAMAARQAAIEAGTAVNKDGSRARKRGQLFEGDTVYWYRINRGTEIRGGTVIALLKNGDVVIRGPNGGESTITPRYNNGCNSYNIVRAEPKDYWLKRRLNNGRP